MEHYGTVPRSSSTLPPFSPSFDVQSNNGVQRTHRHRPSTSMTKQASTSDELSPDVLIRRFGEFSVPSGNSRSVLPNSPSFLTLPPLSPTASSRHTTPQHGNEPYSVHYRTASDAPSNHINFTTDRTRSKQTMGYLLNGSPTYSSDMLTPPISFVHSSSSTSSLPSVKHHHHHSSANFSNVHPCRKCDSVFPTREALSNHTKTHHRNDRPFQCDWPNCGHRFIKKDHAVKHWRVVHLKERPFKCPSCESRFGQRSDLNKHHRSVHEGLKPFECGYANCGHRFSHRGNLIRHQTVVHHKKKPFPCSLCSVAFAEKSNLVKHIQAVHKMSPSSYTPLPARAQHQHQ